MKDILKKEMRKTWFVVIVMFLAAAVGIALMPDIVPTHFGPSGEADEWGSKFQTLLFPIVVLIITILAEPMKKRDPKAENYERFKAYYYGFFFGFSLFFLLIELAYIAVGLGMKLNMGSAIGFLVGIFMVALGNVMPKIKQNFFFGIKTPWTVSDEEVWFQTHRFGGKFMVISGLLLMAAAFIPGQAKFQAFIIVMVVMVLGILSYLFWIVKRKTYKK